MEASKFVKAQCQKTNQYFGLEIRKYGSTWKVVNMIRLSDTEARLISSEEKLDYFETNSNLLPCRKCGNRRVGGCSCSKKEHQCTVSMKYKFDCIYCEDFKIDYSLPTRSRISDIQNGTVTLSQGQEVKIRYANDNTLSKIEVGVGWDPVSVFGERDIDVDSSVIVISEQGSEIDLVYFGDLVHASNCVIHHGDNLTGHDKTNTDDENISIFLDKVPLNRDRLIFVLNIYDCVNRIQTFDKVNNLYIRLYDPDSKKNLVEYRITGNFKYDTALIIGMVYRKDNIWTFKAIGKGTGAHNLAQLSRECVAYCGL